VICVIFILLFLFSSLAFSVTRIAVTALALQLGHLDLS
jgi:hypothetical protein